MHHSSLFPAPCKPLSTRIPYLTHRRWLHHAFAIPFWRREHVPLRVVEVSILYRIACVTGAADPTPGQPAWHTAKRLAAVICTARPARQSLQSATVPGRPAASNVQTATGSYGIPVTSLYVCTSVRGTVSSHVLLNYADLDRGLAGATLNKRMQQTFRDARTQNCDKLAAAGKSDWKLAWHLLSRKHPASYDKNKLTRIRTHSKH